jgi:hypothetical protein
VCVLRVEEWVERGRKLTKCWVFKIADHHCEVALGQRWEERERREVTMEQEEGSTSSEGRCSLDHIKVMQNTEMGRSDSGRPTISL